MVDRRYEVIVVGGGHAGVEAAWAAANVLLPGVSRGGPRPVALVTLDPSKIGEMSCNPAIGGLAKGQLVREVDALGGVMGLATDATSIHSRVLNTSKGPAVRGPRAQCDKHAYARTVRAMLDAHPGIDVLRGSVGELVIRGGVCRGVQVCAGDGVVNLEASAVVLTTGTFMRGLMHTGEDRTPGGRFGEGAASAISRALEEAGFELGRLKTGTPPRLRRGSIRWEALEAQWGDEPPVPFSDLSGVGPEGADSRGPAGMSLEHLPCIEKFPVMRQVDCRQTQTTDDAHGCIRENLHRAPMFSGQIESIGPRYCPSIEDKVVRFSERTSHGVYLEPESLETDWVYCNGISTSLPRDVQDRIVRSMPGCEEAEILRYGYAVEYDMVRPHQIRATCETKRVEGLFLAGQINGTSGYEEAAGQGIVAGLNAARRAAGSGEVIFGRDEAYIGVLMDDLVTRTPVEPYRMFTSRAEHRLLLRADNSADRLTGRAAELGLLSGVLGSLREARFRERTEQLERVRAEIDRARVEGTELAKVVRRPEFSLQDLQRVLLGVCARDDVWLTAYAERRYEPLLVRARAEIRRQAATEHRRLPECIDEGRLAVMRTEAREAILRFRPATFGQASRLEGVTPSDMTLLAVLLGRS